jgi:hypothetical protein
LALERIAFEHKRKTAEEQQDRKLKKKNQRRAEREKEQNDGENAY